MTRPRFRSSERGIGRREVLRSCIGGALGLAPVAGLALGGCDVVAQGAHDFQTYFVLKKSPGGRFGGWTEINLDTAPGPEDQAVLKSVLLYAPEGLSDLTFIQSMLGQSTPPSGQATALLKGGNFPKNDTIGLLDVLYKDNIGPFFKDRTIRIDWSGQHDPSFPFPANGFYKIDAKVTVEVL